MISMHRTSAVLLAAALTALTGAPATAHAGEDHGGEHEQVHSRAGAGQPMAKVKRDLSRFKDVGVAMAEGYLPVSPCETSPEGGMGYHFLNPLHVGADPTAPSVLLYEPEADGSLHLAGVEWFVPDADQDLATAGDRPSLWGRGFDGPMAGHGPGMPVHYDLHVWLYEANPRGVFEPWNPRVSC